MQQTAYRNPVREDSGRALDLKNPDLKDIALLAMVILRRRMLSILLLSGIMTSIAATTASTSACGIIFAAQTPVCAPLPTLIHGRRNDFRLTAGSLPDHSMRDRPRGRVSLTCIACRAAGRGLARLYG